MKPDLFAKRIKFWDENFDRKDFGERQGNEIFLYNINFLSPLPYVTPFSIKYVYHGCEQFKVNGIINPVKQKQLLIINNQSEVVCELHTSLLLHKGLSFFLSPDLIADVINTNKKMQKELPDLDDHSIEIPVFYDNVIKEDTRLIEYFDCQFKKLFACRDGCIDQAYYYAICETLLQSQFNLLGKTQNINKIKYATKLEILKRVMRAKEIIQSTSSQKFNLENVAKEAAMSKYFLIKSFKQVYNTTPNQYHINIKIEKAKHLLLKNNSVSDIAYTLNYPTVFSFSRQFKMCTGYSPALYRKVIS